jgi:hypothetical protein
MRQAYHLLLYLYPPVFRGEFGLEMEDVFAQLSDEARRRGWSALAHALWAELADLPASLAHQYWLAFTRREGIMNGTLQLGQLLDEEISAAGGESSPASWREALLAAAPFLVLLPILVTSKLLVLSGLAVWGSNLLRVVDICYALLVFASVLATLVVAWRRRWPRWSATWFIVYWLLASIPLMWLASRFEDASLAADVFSEFLGFFLLPMLIACGLYFVARRDPLKSLLAVIPVLVIIWLPHTEFVPDGIEVVVYLIALTIAALAAALITRLGNWRAGMWLLLLAAALIGLPFAYIGIYHGGTLDFSAPGPSPLEVMRSFTPYYLMASTLILGPLLAASFRAVGRRLGRGGDFCYHLALFGMLLLLGAMLCYFFFENDSRVVLEYSWGPWLYRAAWLGLAVYLVGTIALGWLALRRQTRSGRAQYVLLSLLILLLPVVLLLPFQGMFGSGFGVIEDLLQMYGRVPSLSFALGFAWFLLAGWLLTRREPPPKMELA